LLMLLLKIAWVIVLFPLIVALGSAWAKFVTAENSVRRRSPSVSWAVVAVLAIMPAVTIATVWPIRLAFLVLRPSLERLADQVETGHAIVSPRSIGPYQLSASGCDPDSKTVGLFIDPNPSGRTGFVRVHSEEHEMQSFGWLLGTDTNIELGWGWSYRQDD
jgi:hypothetical protein